MNKIHVTGGSVQLRLIVSKNRTAPKPEDDAYLVDVWKDGARWRWTAKQEGGTKLCDSGERESWSDARTAAFRATVRRAEGVIAGTRPPPGKLSQHLETAGVPKKRG